MMRFPLKKIRKQFKLLLLLVLLTFAIGFTYLHINQGKAIKLHFNYGKDMEKQTEGLGSGHKKLPNSSPNHPDREESSDSGEEVQGARTTVKKLAVAPKWKNYGLRIFGFIHPYKDGDFQFAVASDDNSELWLSSDENPLNARLLVYVGRHGSEWTAPGEFTKFRSQTSKSVHLMSSRRYYFEILHKQDDKGSDHVEVGWRPFLPGLKYDVIDSAYISLYTDESSLKMNSVKHIPQTLASHTLSLQEPRGTDTHSADMLKPDPRDSFYKSELTHMERENKCFYRESPVYLEKFGFYKYMKMDEDEDDRPAFFPNPDDFLEEEEGVDPEEDSANPSNHHARSIANPEREDGYDVDIRTRAEEDEDEDRESRHGELIGAQHEALNEHKLSAEVGDDPQIQAHVYGQRRSLMWIQIQSNKVVPLKLSKMSQNSQHSSLYALANQILSNVAHPAPIVLKANQQEKEIKTNKIYITRPRPPKSGSSSGSSGISRKPRQVPRPPMEVFPGVFLFHTAKGKKLVDLSNRWKSMKGRGSIPLFFPSLTLTDRKPPTQLVPLKHSRPIVPLPNEQPDEPEEEPEEPEEEPEEPEDTRQSPPTEIQSTRASDTAEESQQRRVPDPEEGGVSQYSYEDTEPRPGWAEEAINWQRTFTVNPVDFELLRSDWNDLRCNVSGNLQLAENEVVDVLSQYIERLNEHNGGIYTLLRIVNVEKRRDSARGSRYLVELELMEAGKRVVRLSEYIYLLLHRGRQDDGVGSREASTPSAPTAPSKPPHSPPQPPSSSISSSSAQSRASTAWGSHWLKPLLCQPAMLQWRHDVMVHFVVPGNDGFTAQFTRTLYLSYLYLKNTENAFFLNTVPNLKVNGFGLFGIYKSDFDKIGGMNTEEFKDRWGGEDWEFLDRVLQNGLEVERLRLRNFYHYYHSKRGMWNSAVKKPAQG
uniref:Beta-1,4-N-acetyl-galactosaminyl transferase 4b n=1 Tax=Astyanax mexicanus TaxID=7994 RepID=A0A8B9HGY3_ASTMX